MSMPPDRLTWDRDQLGDWRALSIHFVGSREFCIRPLADGRRELMVTAMPDGSGWVLLATYDDQLDAQDAAAYYDQWGRIPSHIPRSES